MTVLSLRTHPDPILNRVAPPVVLFTPELKLFARDMLETMHAEKGIGLAAPQVGHSVRVIVIKKCPEDLVMVNPQVIERSDRETTWPEECLSCPGKRVIVSRPKWVYVSWQTVEGVEKSARFSHLDGRVVQHEMDHLDGKLIAW